MSTVLVVGESPARRGDAALTGRRFLDLAGVERREDAADWVNLIGSWPGCEGRGSAFPLAAAREAAERVAPRLRSYEAVLLLGRRVERAFRLWPGTSPYFEWREAAETRVAVFPHPSGLNKFWNDRDATDRARRFLRSATRG